MAKNSSLKKILLILFLFSLSACASKENPQPTSNTETKEETQMKLYINDTEIPVTWENNESVQELEDDIKNEDIIVSMSMYSNNEQVGSLGKSYTSNDARMTTQNGDLVLYNSSQIVVFYNPNTWEYTKLGKISLSKEEVINLLSNGNIELKLSNH